MPARFHHHSRLADVDAEHLEEHRVVRLAACRDHHDREAAAGSIALASPELNGAVLGVAAWIMSYAVETAVSAWRLRKLGWNVEG
jgi:hypothetical protein